MEGFSGNKNEESSEKSEPSNAVPRTGLLHDPYTSARGVLKVFAPLSGLSLFVYPHLQASLHAPKQKSLPRYRGEDFVPRTGFEPAHPCGRCDLIRRGGLPISSSD